MLKRGKDLSLLVARTRFKADNGNHYWDVFLWPSVAVMDANTVDDNSDASACHCSPRIWIDPESGHYLPPERLGEVHFVRGKWDMEVVAHELAHALFLRLKVACPGYRRILEGWEMGQEELVCYDFGRWMQHVYKWLWTTDTPVKSATDQEA